MKKEELKKLAKTHGGFKYIENDISGEIQYIDDGIYEEGVLKGIGKIKRIFFPYTRSSLFSDWMFCIEVTYKRRNYNVWFKIFQNEYYLHHIWNGRTGKKARRDARWNIEEQMKITAGLNSLA